MTRSSWHGEKCHKHSQWKYSMKKWRQRETKNVRKIQGNLRKQRYKNKFDWWEMKMLWNIETQNGKWSFRLNQRRSAHMEYITQKVCMRINVEIHKNNNNFEGDEKRRKKTQQIGETKTDLKWNKYQLQSNWILLIPRVQPNQMSPLEIQRSSESNRIITVYMEQFVLVNTFLKRTSLP